MMGSVFEDAKKAREKKQGLFKRIIRKQKERRERAKAESEVRKEREDILRRKEKEAFQKGRDKARIRAATTRGSQTIMQPIKVKRLTEKQRRARTEQRRSGIQDAVGGIGGSSVVSGQGLGDIYGSLGGITKNKKQKKGSDISKAMGKLI